MLRIRLRRMGLRNRPTYRVVVIDSRKARDGEYIESVGSYDPKTKLLNINTARVHFWLGHGAQPSGTVARLIKRYERQHPSNVTGEEAAATTTMAQTSTAEPVVTPETAN